MEDSDERGRMQARGRVRGCPVNGVLGRPRRARPNQADNFARRVLTERYDSSGASTAAMTGLTALLDGSNERQLPRRGLRRPASDEESPVPVSLCHKPYRDMGYDGASVQAKDGVGKPSPPGWRRSHFGPACASSPPALRMSTRPRKCLVLPVLVSVVGRRKIGR